jgi:hypothetical protein
VCWRGRG